MIQNPLCSFETVYHMLSGSNEIAVFRLNDSELLYKGDLKGAIKGLKTDYRNLVVVYNGVYINRTTGTLDIEVWDLTILEDPDL